MEILLDPEEKILCPYNSAHHIMRKRMNTHLVKCKKNYPDSRLVECDFNTNHKIPEPELQYHNENCPDRRTIEHAVYVEEGHESNRFPIVNIDVPTSENWDDCHYSTYNPQQNIENKEILRSLNVESAAKRRDFRINERKRLAQLQEKKVDSHSQKSVSKIPNEPSTSRDEKEVHVPQTSSSIKIVKDNNPDHLDDIINSINLGRKRYFIPKT